MKPRKISLILGITSCLLGGLIYILLRSKDLILFSWINSIRANPIVEWFRLYTYGIIHNEFIIYSLPDGLWLLSYIMIIGSIWNMDILRTVLFVFPLAAFAIGCEGLQKAKLVNGTFDWNDIISYILAIILGFSVLTIININNNKITKKQKDNEKE